ncbi:MAG: hypothetical protein H6738_22000 [Alphaproteobacteria bacterium]|nr:hypothetical protein [Alphaproteobacteria bacterium]MCB9699472.1 hypothetical protein [Alphaproteobacteria bacterium]
MIAWWCISAFGATPSSVAVSSDARWVAVGGDGVVVLYGAADLGEKYRRTLDVGVVLADFLPDDRLAATGIRNRKAMVWDPTTGALLREATEPFPCQDSWEARWWCDAPTSGRRVSFTGSYTRSIQVDGWDGTTLTRARELLDPPGADVSRLALGSGDRLIVAGNGGQSLTRTTTPPGASEPAPVTSRAGWVRVRRGGDLVCEQLELPGLLSSMEASADGVVVGDRDGSVTWLGPDCAVVATRKVSEAAVVGLAPVPGTPRVVVVDAAGGIAVVTPQETLLSARFGP